jgi:hypothetical protein
LQNNNNPLVPIVCEIVMTLVLGGGALGVSAAPVRARVDGLADVDAVNAHLDRQGDFSNHVAGMRTDHAAAQDLAMGKRPSKKDKLRAQAARQAT